MDELVWDSMWHKWVHPDEMWQRRADKLAELYPIKEAPDVFPDMSPDEVLMILDEEEGELG